MMEWDHCLVNPLTRDQQEAYFFLREAVLVALDIGISVHSYQTHDAARISGHPHTKRLVGLKGVGWSHRLQS